MKKIRFTGDDAGIIYCVPKAGGTIEQINEWNAFRQRIAIPENHVVKVSLDKAIEAGIVRTDSHSQYYITDAWYSVVHQFDKKNSATEYAMIEFEEFLCAKEWDSVR